MTPPFRIGIMQLTMEARSSTALSPLVARETQRLAVGWGIISPFTRHPIQIAMEARVTQEAAGEGRFYLGLGVSKIFMPGAAGLGRAQRPGADGEAAPRRGELRDPGRPPLEGVGEDPARHGRAEAELQLREGRGAAVEYAKLSSKGQGVGAIVAMETEFNLTPEGERTSMRWEADVRIAGPIGSMGQRVFQPIVTQQVTNVPDALEKVVEEAKGGGSAGGAEEGIHPGSPEAYSSEPEGPTHAAE